MKNKGIIFSAIFVLLAMIAGAASVEAASTGAVYTISNAANGNSVLIFARAVDGTLTPAGSVETKGFGTGTGLGDQGAVALNGKRNLLFAVNAGSNEISAFKVGKDGLTLVDTVPSGGVLPKSLTVHRDILYVLNAGGNAGDTDNITGFRISENGKLSPIPGSTRPLSAAVTDPAEVRFNQKGTLLVVTEKAANTIDTYVVDEDGVAGAPNSQPSSGITPFGFAAGRRDRIFVSEAFGGAADASALSSYQLSEDGSFQVISPSVRTTETSACWVALTGDNRFAYVTNTGSSTVTGYAVNEDGSVSLLNSDGVTAHTGTSPIDVALTKDSRFLYTHNSGSHSISLFAVGEDGSLISLGPDVTGLPPGASGLAVR